MLPIHAKLVVYRPLGEHLSCGSMFLLSSSYSGDDGCENRLFGRFGEDLHRWRLRRAAESFHP
jgi:hypothetical protein